MNSCGFFCGFSKLPFSVQKVLFRDSFYFINKMQVCLIRNSHIKLDFSLLFFLSDFDIIRILRNFARGRIVDFHSAFIILSQWQTKQKKN